MAEPSGCLLGAEVVMHLLGGDPVASRPVLDFMEAHRRWTLFVSALGIAWIRSDVARLPDAAQRMRLEDELDRVVVPRFAGRMLPLDDAALRQWAIVRNVEVAGTRLATETALETAIALSMDFPLVARTSAELVATGVTVIDPWQPAATSAVGP